MSDQTSRQAFEQPRGEWPRMLAAVPQSDVIRCSEAFRASFRLEPRMLPATGLALLRMREGCFGESYHIGELPLAECAIDLVDAHGHRFAGGARVMSSSAEYAEAVAVLDAVLAHRLSGWRAAAELLQRGRDSVNATDARRAEIRERTSVEFALLSAAGGDDDEA
jgi:alpha-D-ribose 1-methylphosphonate 5-triphosphate synthase subunit PhnG